MRSRRRMSVESLEDRRMLATFTVSNLLDGTVVAAGDLPGSLRQAIFDANNTAGDDEIVFEGTVGTITLDFGELQIAEALEIVGPGQEQLTIDAGNGTNGIFGDGDGWRIFKADNGSAGLIDVTISGMTLTGGDVQGGGSLATSNGGGAILNRERLTIVECTISGNSVAGSTTGAGGGIASINGELTLTSSTLSGNSAAASGACGDQGKGGGLYAFGGQSVVTDSTISGNTSSRHGGGISTVGGNTSITGSTVSGNIASGTYLDPYGDSWTEGYGGGISVESPSGSLTISSSTVIGNRAGEVGDGGSGGGIFVSVGSANVTECIITQNTAGSGGGIEATDLTISNSEIIDNVASDGGGGGIVGRAFAVDHDGLFNITDCVISNNTATGSGGGILGAANVLRSSIIGNSSVGRGGGAWSASRLDIIDSTVDSNFTTGNGAHGGGIFGESNITITNSAVTNNYTTGVQSHGGGIANLLASTYIRNSTVSGNSTVDGRGGGLYSRLWATIDNSTITNNTAPVGVGSGVAVAGSSASFFVRVKNSIIAGNTNEDLAVVGGTVNHLESSGYNVIGTGNVYDGSNNAVDVFNQPGDVTSVLDPLLGALADNAGPTKTHALLAGSPAIDTGDPAFASPPDFDQRGTGFDRVAGGRIDIGAYEVQAPATLPGDFDGDGDVDGRDFMLWQRGASPAPLSSGDLSDWQGNYGSNGLSALSAPLEASEAETENEIASSPASFWIDSADESETVSLVVAPEDVEFVESIDRAFDDLSALPVRSVRGFGEMVARRVMTKSLPKEFLISDL